METYRKNRLKITDYLFDLLPPNERKEVGDTINNDPLSKWCYDQVRRSITIESYLGNEMSLQEKAEFEQELNADYRLAEEVNFRKRVYFAGKTLTYREELEEAHDEFVKSHSGFYLLDNLSPRVKRFLAAASILLMLALGSMAIINTATTGERQESRLYAKYYEPFKSELLFNYLHDANELYEARCLYERGNYKDALCVYNVLPDSFDVKVEKQFYEGLIYMETGQFNQAIKNFEYLDNHAETGLMRPYIKWYLGMRYLNTLQEEKEKDILNEIVSFHGFNYKKAGKILKKLS